MLRSLLIALLAANLLFFAWSRSVVPADPGQGMAPSAPLPATTGQIPPAVVPPPVCTSLGPFVEQSAAEQAASRLAAGGRPSQQRVAEQQVPDGYWVYVTSRDAADQRSTVAAIKASGVEDAYAMPEDPGFRVSAGIFSDEARAQQRARRVAVLRLDAKVENHLRLRNVHWLDLPNAPPAAVSPEVLAGLGITDPDLAPTACP